MSLTLKRSLKNKICYVVFECLACNLLHISPLKLFLEAEIFLIMCSQNVGNAIGET